MKIVHLVTLSAAFSCMCNGAALAATIHDEAEVAVCIRQAAQGKMWLEKTLWGLRDQEAGWVGAEVANSNGTHDLGVLQVNSGWVPRLARMVRRPEVQIRNRLVFDPCFNAEVARWIFLSALKQTGDFWKAVGAYHSPSVWRQRHYVYMVAVHLRRRFGGDVFSSASIHMKFNDGRR